MNKKNFGKDSDAPSKRLDRIDKMEIDLAHYEQMERDIEKIIEPYQFDWDLDWLSLPNAIQSIFRRKEQELQEAMDNYVKLDNQRVKEYNELVDKYTAKEQECEELKKELQAQLDFTAHEQKLIYCVAYDETCKTGKGCKQEKCIFKDNIKLKQTLTEIKEIADKDFRHTAWEEYAKQLKQILQKISECEGNNE